MTKRTCYHLQFISQIVKDRYSDSASYSNSYYWCDKLKKRMAKKRDCHNCVFYEILK